MRHPDAAVNAILDKTTNYPILNKTTCGGYQFVLGINNTIDQSKGKNMSFIQNLRWNPIQSSDEENLRWSMLRAIEWGIWPAFLSGPLVPLLLPFFSWWKIIGVTAILTVLWSFVRYKYVNLALAEFGFYFVLLRWIACPLAAIYLIIQDKYILAILSLIWPVLAASLGILVRGSQIGRIQNMFMEKLGYSMNKQLFEPEIK